MKDKDKQVVGYVCGWCLYQFKQAVKYSKCYGPHGVEAKHGSCSDQVKCPNCGIFLPTWEKEK